MSLQLLLLDGKAAVCDVPGKFSVDDWGDLQSEFFRTAKRRSPKLGEDWCVCVSLYSDQRKFGIYWTEAIAGPDGAYFDLYVAPGVSREQVAELKRELRTRFDVVKIYTHRIKQWVEGFRPEISVNPREVFDEAA